MKKRYSTLIFLLLFVLVQGCKTKPSSFFEGSYKGNATNKANAADIKQLSVTITSKDNPVTGSWTLVGSAINAKGLVSGSILGTILNLSLKPDGSVTTYTLSGTTNDDNTRLTGTIKGVEAAVTVTYDIDLSK